MIVFLLLFPFVCGGAEGDPTKRCETPLGWKLPWFEYSGSGIGPGVGRYVWPIAGALVTFLLVRWVLSLASREDPATPSDG